MAVNNINIENFLIFNKVDIEFSPKVNIAIGENGIGKTNLLKTIYSVSEMAVRNDKSRRTGFIDKYFTNSSNFIRSMKKDKGKGSSIYLYDDNAEASTVWRFTDDINRENIVMEIRTPKEAQNAIYIPVTEMLSHSKGLVAFNQKYDLPFDQTQIDILLNAQLPEIRQLPAWQQDLLLDLGKIINGTVEYINDTFYVKKGDGALVEFSVEAEGYRKLGLLWKLIKNGLFCEENPILLWDEPDSNINPELLPMLTKILLKLADNGVQIFLATHSYSLAKNFEVLRQEENDVNYYNLFKEGDMVRCIKSVHFSQLGSNSLENADEKLFDAIMEKGMS